MLNKEIVLQVGNLPSIPGVAQRILGLDLNTVQGERELLELIGKDPALIAKILSLSNSPIFGVSKKIVSVKEAAALLGLTRVKTVSVGIAMLSALNPKEVEGIDLQKLWQHSINATHCMGILAKFLPSGERPSQDSILLSGLLHDIGYVVLAYVDAEKSKARQTFADRYGKIEQLDNEVGLIGMTHAQLGGALTEHWNLPQEICSSISEHESDSQESILGGILRLSETILEEFCVYENDLLLLGGTESFDNLQKEIESHFGILINLVTKKEKEK